MEFTSKTYAMFVKVGDSWRQYAIQDKETAMGSLTRALPGRIIAQGHESDDRHIAGE